MRWDSVLNSFSRRFQPISVSLRSCHAIFRSLFKKLRLLVSRPGKYRIKCHKVGTMSSPNSSVIICESPRVAENATLSSNVTNYRKRLRSSARSLLETVYESPLNHFRRNLNTITETNDDGSDVTVLLTPPAKKLKTKLSTTDGTNSRQLFNFDESVIIVCDQRAAEPVELAISDTEANDPVEISEDGQVLNSTKLSRKKSKKLTKKKQPNGKVAQPKTPKPRKGKKVIKKTGKNRKSGGSVVKSLTVNDENHNGQIMGSRTSEDQDPVATAEDVEEIEVVWSSRPNAETPGEEVEAMRVKTSPQDLIVVDTVPSLTNVWMNGNSAGQKSPPKRSYDFTTRMDTGPTFSKSSHRQPPCSHGTGTLGLDWRPKSRLREIVVDGSNVAMGHSRNKTFSEKGLQIVINYFESRGHTVKVFLPQSARARGRNLIEKLHVKGTVVFTPSRTIAGKHITPYDDRYILEYATQCHGIVVSSDQFRDLWREKPEWRETIENRLLTPTFVGDYLMFPEDPLGRRGPCLEEFLKY